MARRQILLPRLIDAYVHAAMSHAQLECVEGGAVAATVPQAFGVVALAANERDCLDELITRLAEWVCGALADGEALPIIDGVDPNRAAAETIEFCRALYPARAANEFFESEEQFEAALTRWESGA